ncbi:hypothetical protein CGRA01v4_06341 [Colletotrichum graminicola]|nr:hypothetical protein CGRA01v4_06341 [Colletotrichum graminicola]
MTAAVPHLVTPETCGSWLTWSPRLSDAFLVAVTTVWPPLHTHHLPLRLSLV